ncbi:protealysin inhibitor emfourin [Streptomyces sp. 12297]|uniref:protealysin inhibitor emfourin n=1 Tax=Streptomyces sp. NBC_00239 TaxID=2903640 RepID=UPI002E2E85CA|nr:protealysin inhibitor emfourin [Streptomyces sp. NBC_00239]
MLITVTRTGGFAGQERQGAVTTECRADRAELELLAERALSDDRSVDQPPVADGYHYVVHVDGKVMELHDPYLTENQRQLIRAVLEEGA